MGTGVWTLPFRLLRQCTAISPFLIWSILCPSPRIWEIFFFLTSVMAQNTGIPMGVLCSAQLASIVLIFRDLRTPLPHILSDAMWIRYRDNFLFLILQYPDESQNQRLITDLQCAVSSMMSMQITVEHRAPALKFLQCSLSEPRGPSPIGLPDFVSMTIAETVPQTRKLMDPTAPTVQCMLNSLIHNWTCNALHYRLTPQQATTNLGYLHRLFTQVGYAPTMWRPLFRNQALKWGACLPPHIHSWVSVPSITPGFPTGGSRRHVLLCYVLCLFDILLLFFI